MMTPAEFDGTRRRLLEATGRIIARDGYTALSMRRLGQEVGLSASALYRYFPTRQHVLVSYWSDALDALTRRMEEIASSAYPPAEQIRAMLIAYAEFATEDRDRFRVLFIENDMGLFNEQSEITDALRSYHLFVERVSAAIAAGSIRPLPAPVAAHVLLSAVHGVFTLALALTEIDFGDLRELAEIAAATALRGLVPDLEG